jgi:putative acetyltransferase
VRCESPSGSFYAHRLRIFEVRTAASGIHYLDSGDILNIRAATSQDLDSSRRLHLRAFPEPEGGVVARLACDLLSTATIPSTLSLLALIDGAVVGHVAFSPVGIAANQDFEGYILAPLGIDPEYQGRGLGSQLVGYGLRKLMARGTNAVFVYGDPAYYGRFGFSADAAEPFRTPYRLQYPFGWQAILIGDRALGDEPVTIGCAAPLCDPELW